MSSTTIKGDENKYFLRLQEWAGDDKHTLKILYMTVTCEPVYDIQGRKIDGNYKVPNSKGTAFYDVMLDPKSCPCRGFAFNRNCTHLQAARLRTIIENKRHNISLAATTVGLGETVAAIVAAREKEYMTITATGEIIEGKFEDFKIEDFDPDEIPFG